MKQRFANLINVKTIVTFGLVGVYLYMNIAGMPVADYFTGLVGLVVGFYFGTQKQKQEG